jgi:hypothetical protein
MKIVSLDGAMLASKDFSFMLSFGLLSMVAQIFLLNTWCTTISDIFTTFTIRLGSYAIVSLIRAGFGYGKLGKALLMKTGSEAIFDSKSINGAVNGVQASTAKSH